MPIPTLDKIWTIAEYDMSVQFNLDAATAWRATSQKIVRQIKNFLVGTGVWSVYYSCDAVTAGVAGDLVDRWDSDTDLIWNNPSYTGIKSWMVLKRTNAGGAGKDLYLLIVCEDSAGAPPNWARGLYIELAYNAYTGGSTTARPTATDSRVVLNSSVGGGETYYTSESVYPFDGYFITLNSTDNDVQRMFLMKDNTCVLYIAAEKIKNPTTGWTHPYTFTWKRGPASYAMLNDAASYSWGYDGNAVASWFNFYHATEGHVASMLGERIVYRNEITGEGAVTPAVLVSDTYGKRGRHGEFYDLWFVSTNMLTGDTYPNDETALMLVLDEVAVPWNGGAVRTI